MHKHIVQWCIFQNTHFISQLHSNSIKTFSAFTYSTSLPRLLLPGERGSTSTGKVRGSNGCDFRRSSIAEWPYSM